MMTKLEAVNAMLAAIGEDPVSSLTDPVPDAEAAESFLDRVSKRVQSQGWHCNRVPKRTYTPNASGYILAPDTWLFVDTTGRSARINVVPRVIAGQRRLWNVDEDTDVFTQPLDLELIEFLPFESLTYTLQNYIAALATKRFQSGDLTSTAMDAFVSEEERMAWADLLSAEAESEDANMIHSNSHGSYITARNWYPWSS